jgi:group I intron endonuclease
MSKTYNPGVYVITNVVSGKFYIGSSLWIMNRITGHKRDLRTGKHCNKYLQAAYNKYGEDAFEYNIMELCTEEELISCEQNYIDKYWDYGILYNINPTAGNTRGRLNSAATRKKISEALRAKKTVWTDERRANHSAQRRGRWHSPETVAKMIASKTGKKWSEESKAKNRETRRSNRERKQQELENGNH